MWTAQKREEFHRAGFVRLGQVMSGGQLADLQERIDAIMLGRVIYAEMPFQVDSATGAYRDLEWRSHRWQGPRLDYRKILQLERDPLFREYLRHPVFRAVTRELIGEQISVFRAMFMNKPAARGTVLPYHQDGGSMWELDRDPLVTVWTALDEATREKGCLEVIPGTHRLGLLSDGGHTITEEMERRYCPPGASVFLEAAAGEAILLHNHLLHRSGVNPAAEPRRALSVVYMDAATRHVRTGAAFPPLFTADDAAA